MRQAALLAKILGSLFYYTPARDDIFCLIMDLKDVIGRFEWRDGKKIDPILEELAAPERKELIWQFSVLFEGQGVMVAPPWGAVYQDKDGLLMSASTLRYREFLEKNQLRFTSSINEPEDQFGLMLLALSYFLETDNRAAAQELLDEHLLTWSGPYLQRLIENEVSPIYAALGKIASIFLAEIRPGEELAPL